MRSISDNELDKLFQDAAQRVEPEFDPGDWDELSKRIDRSDRINLFKRIAIYLSVALLIIFSTWIGVNYYKGQADNKKDSVSNGVESDVSDTSVNSKKEIDSGASSSAQHASIDGGADNGTSTGSTSDKATSSSSIQNNETSSAGDQALSASENNTDTHKSKDIAHAGEHRAATATSTTTDQSAAQSSLKKGNVQRKSGLSAHAKDQNGSTINKTAGSLETADDQQKIQKPKRTIAGAEESRDEGSLSASGNSNSDRVDEKLSSTSTNQQHLSAVSSEGKSVLSNTTAPDEKTTTQLSTKSVANNVVNNEVKDGRAQNDAGISSDVQPSSTTTNEAAVSTSSIENTTDVKSNGTIQKDNTTPVNNDQTSGADQVNPVATSTSSLKSSDQKSNSLNSVGDTLTIADVSTKDKNVQNNSVKSNTVVNQSGKTDQTITDTLSAKPSLLKSKDNIVLAGDTKDIAVKTPGIVSNDPSTEKSTSKENSLPGREPGTSNEYQKNNGTSINDTLITIDHARSNTNNNASAKKVDDGVVKDNIQQSSEADRVAPKADSLSDKESDLKSKDDTYPAASDKNKNALIYNTKNGAIDKTSENAGMAKQNSSSTSGIPGDSLSNQKESTTSGKIRHESNAIAVNDSTNAKPILAKADSIDRAKDNKEATEDKSEKEEKAKESNWYVKLLVSPDFSAIGYTKPGKTGFNIGLTVEYSPTKHWGISTGAIWSKKLYDKNNPGKAYSYGGTSFEANYLDGDCRVLDIPINITYYIVPEARLNFYATVGVSSYIMLKENYVYTVTENNNNYYYYEDYKNENRHWFSMLNLSFGVQYRVSPRLYFQAEPFLKAPMSGIGQGKIDLVSVGSFFALKYKINK